MPFKVKNDRRKDGPSLVELALEPSNDRSVALVGYDGEKSKCLLLFTEVDGQLVVERLRFAQLKGLETDSEGRLEILD